MWKIFETQVPQGLIAGWNVKILVNISIVPVFPSNFQNQRNAVILLAVKKCLFGFFLIKKVFLLDHYMHSITNLNFFMGETKSHSFTEFRQQFWMTINVNYFQVKTHQLQVQ